MACDILGNARIASTRMDETLDFFRNEDMFESKRWIRVETPRTKRGISSVDLSQVWLEQFRYR